jgi:hypothetical protein
VTTAPSGDLVCITGDFCSGSTLVYTLFRQTGRYRCLYEPLHEDLREFLVYGLRPEEQSHHFFVGPYHAEFRGLRKAASLFRRRFGISRLHLTADEADPELERFLRYLIDESFARAPHVMFKENRLAFRLAWFRKRFPSAKVIHISRGVEAQWRSIVRRVQVHRQRDDVGQDRPDFNGFSVATFCEDLKASFPELDASRSRTGFERFEKLWRLSDEANRRDADVSIAYEDLIRAFQPTARVMFDAVGAADVDVERLAAFVVPPQRQAEVAGRMQGLSTRAAATADRVMRRLAAEYARRRWIREP